MFEVHGIRGARAVTTTGLKDTTSVLISEDEDGVRVLVTPSAQAACLTPEEARYVADKLYRLADQVEARTAVAV